MRGLPANHRCRNIVFDCKFTGTKDAADEVDPTQFAQAIATMTFGRYMLPFGGLELSYLNHKIYGAEINATDAVPGSGTTFLAEFFLVMPMADPRMMKPDESSLPTELLWPEEFKMSFAADDVYGVGSVAITAGNVFPFAELLNDEQAKGLGLNKVPDIRQIGHIAGTQDINLETGQYHDLYCHEGQNFTLVTAAEMTDISLHVEGMTVLDLITNRELRARWNQNHARGRDERLSLMSTGSLWLPVVDPQYNANSRRLHSPTVVKSTGGRLRSTGSVTAPGYGFWKTTPKTQGDTEEVASKLGLDPGSVQFISDIKKEGATNLQQGLVSGVLVQNTRATRSPVSGSPRPFGRD